MIRMREALAFSLCVHAVFLWGGTLSIAPESVTETSLRNSLSVRVVTAARAFEQPVAELEKRGESGQGIASRGSRQSLQSGSTAGRVPAPARETGITSAVLEVPSRKVGPALHSEGPGREAEVERVVPDSVMAAGGAAGSLVSDRPVSTAQTVAASEVRPASDQEDVRSYRLQLAALAAGFKEYPTIARERGWEGVVGIQLRLLPDRPFPEVSLARSSGVHALDEAALGMIAKASRTVGIPRELRGRLLNVDLPVDYRLD